MRHLASIAAACILSLLPPLAGSTWRYTPVHAASVTITVTTTADISVCSSAVVSLRCAMVQANAADSDVTIIFAIPAGDPGCSRSPTVCVITPLSPLPPLTARSTVIDGGTPSGGVLSRTVATSGDSASLVIRLDGIRAGFNAPGLTIRGQDDTVRGLSITSFTGPGIFITTGAASDCTVQGNFIGVAPNGTAMGNGGGVLMDNGAGSELIGGTATGEGNLVSNNAYGIRITGGGMNIVAGNVVGTNPSASAAQPNRGPGITLTSTSGNTIGGIGSRGGNLIAGNKGPGLSLTQTGGSLVEGNLIGLNKAGRALPNTGNGVVVTEASNNTIGGGAAGAGNTISGNRKYGIEMRSSGINQIQGNRVGTNVSGNAALPNGAGGVALISTSTTIIGGATAGERNIVSGNHGPGILLHSAGGNTIEGNYIGATAAGSSALGNTGDGILFVSLDHDRVLRNIVDANGHGGIEIKGAGDDLVQGNRIGVGAHRERLGNGGNGVYLHAGSTGDSVTANVIAANRGAGVMVGDSGTDQTREAISRNAIFGNSGLGIDLWPAGRVNCSHPSPIAPNGYTPCPKIERASRTSVAGRSCSRCRVEVFIASGNWSGHGQGERYLGAAVATSHGQWHLGIAKHKVAARASLTATATRDTGPDRETSEFSANRRL